MIGKLKGKLVEIDKNIGLIETASGVFYQVYLPPSLLSAFQPPSSLEIYTYLQVREDTLILYGFPTKKQYDFFVMLLSVSGIGPKTAFSIISFLNVNEIIQAVSQNDLNIFSRVPGLGKKTAMKIILELSQKLKEKFSLEKMYLSEEDKTVIDALIALGYKTSEAKAIFSRLPKNLSVEEKIKLALKKQ